MKVETVFCYFEEVRTEIKNARIHSTLRYFLQEEGLFKALGYRGQNELKFYCVSFNELRMTKYWIWNEMELSGLGQI